MKTKQSLQQGFTLIELLVALSISAVLLVSVGSVFTSGIKQTRVISGDARLVEAASLLTNTLTLNVRPARSIQVVSDELVITNQDYSTSTLALSGGEVQYEGVNILHSSVSADYLQFSVIGRTVQMSFALSAETGTNNTYTTEPLLGTTTVAVRNQ